MKWPSLLYRSPSRQPRQAIAPAKYSNLKCVSRLRATRYKLLTEKFVSSRKFSDLYLRHRLINFFSKFPGKALILPVSESRLFPSTPLPIRSLVVTLPFDTIRLMSQRDRH